jgi:hypothetical protein
MLLKLLGNESGRELITLLSNSLMPDRLAPKTTRMIGDRVLRIIAVVGFGLMLGACSKCDVPDWFHTGSGTAPHVCHDAPPPQ